MLLPIFIFSIRLQWYARNLFLSHVLTKTSCVPQYLHFYVSYDHNFLLTHSLDVKESFEYLYHVLRMIFGAHTQLFKVVPLTKNCSKSQNWISSKSRSGNVWEAIFQEKLLLNSCARAKNHCKHMI